MMAVREDNGKIYTNFQTPGKHEFYTRLYEAWERGQIEADDWFQEDPDQFATPYAYVCAGIARMLKDVIRPNWWGKNHCALDIDYLFGDVARRVPSNADAAMVYNELRRVYPELMKGRGGYSGDRKR